VAEKIKISDECKLAMENTALMTKGLEGEELHGAIKEGLGEVGKAKRITQAGLEYAINGMLSGTMTPIANAVSIAIQQITQPLMVALGSVTDAMKITKGNRQFRDAVAMVQAVMEGFTADTYFFSQGWQKGMPLDNDVSFKMFAATRGMDVTKARQEVNKLIVNRRIANMEKEAGRSFTPEEAEEIRKSALFSQKNAISEQDIKDFFEEEYDYVRNAIRGPAGRFIRIPTRLTVGIDEYGKARFRRMKIAQLASIKAREDAAAGKGTYDELFKKYQKESLGDLNTKNPAREELLELEKRLGKVFGQSEDDFMPYQEVKDFTLMNTFQSPLVGIPKELQKIQKNNAFINYMIPFIKTPWNILKEGVSYTPVLGIGLRPSYRKLTDQGYVIEKLSKDEIIPRQMLGLSMFAGVYAMFEAGSITGAPRDGQEAMEWRAKGIQPFSVRIGDTWVPYQRIEPVATPLGLAADLFRAHYDYVNDPNPDKELYDNFIKNTLIGLKSHITSKSFMEGFATLTEVVTDPARAGEQFASAMLRPTIPAIVNEAARLTDSKERLAGSPIEALQKRIPVARQALPQDFDPLSPEGRQTDVNQAITGFPIRSESDRSPIQVEAGRVNADVGRITDKLKGVGLSSEQTARLRQMYAEALEPRLSAYIQSPFYQGMSDAKKKVALEKLATKIRADVRKKYTYELFRTDRDVARKMRNKLLEKAGLPEEMQ
jgi:hypothetical protein